jgi:hypothetical protein
MNRADLDALDRAGLVALALRQAERIAELERGALRGAAPFARPEGKRLPSPQRPGRKGGHAGVSGFGAGGRTSRRKSVRTL